MQFNEKHSRNSEIEDSVIKNRIFSVIIIVLAFIFSYFIMQYYPLVNSFDYIHMTNAIYTEKSGFVEPRYQNPGFIILTVIISVISGLSYDVIPTLPIQSIPLALLLIMLIRNITEQKSTSYLVIMGLVLISITRYGSQYYLGYWSHGLGVILALLVLSTVTLRFRLEQKNKWAISLILMIIILSINYISYKLTFFTIGTLVILEIVEWISYLRCHSGIVPKKINFITITTMSLVYVLTFNNFFYNAFLPSMRGQSEIFTGLYKLFLRFGENPFDPLNQFYLRTPQDLAYAYLIFLSIMFIGLVSLTKTFFQRIIKKEILTIGEKIIYAMVASSCLILILYTYAGYSEGSLLTLSIIIAYSVLYNLGTMKRKKVIKVVISLMLILNTYTAISIFLSQDFYAGMKDWNYSLYINGSSKWYTKYMFNEDSKMNRSIVSDAFTRGYFTKEIAKENLPASCFYRMFFKNDVIFLLKPDISSKIENTVFVINYRLNNFMAANWEDFSSWSKHREFIESNPYLSSVYSSGDVVIYVSAK